MPALQTRFMSRVDDAAALDVDELGVLAADLDDGEAAAAVRVERARPPSACATISFCTVSRAPRSG